MQEKNQKKNQIISTAKTYMLKLVQVRLLKLLLVNMKANSNILIRSEMAGKAETKQKYLIFIVVPQVRVEKTISLN